MNRKAYVVANLEVIHDRDKFRDYERGLVKSLGRHCLLYTSDAADD